MCAFEEWRASADTGILTLNPAADTGVLWSSTGHQGHPREDQSLRALVQSEPGRKSTPALVYSDFYGVNNLPVGLVAPFLYGARKNKNPKAKEENRGGSGKLPGQKSAQDLKIPASPLLVLLPKRSHGSEHRALPQDKL